MASCPNCGNTVAEQAKFCPSCGAVQPSRPAGPTPPAMPGMQPPPFQTGYAPRRTEGMAVASLVLGIAGIIICPLICSILAIVFGSQAKGKIAADPSLEGEGMAKAGVVLGWIGIALSILWVFAFVAMFNAAESVQFETPSFNLEMTPGFPG